MAHSSPLTHRLVALCTAVLVGAGTVAAGVLSASAYDKGTMVLASGETRTIVSTEPQAPSSALTWTPQGCRQRPSDSTCDVYSVNLLRDDHPDAQNFVRVSVSWDTARTPNLGAVAAGLNPVLLTDLDVYVFDLSNPAAPARLSPDQIGGNGIQIPERVGWIADFDKYALIVHNSGPHASVGYKMTIAFSNERFAAPFEALDPETQVQVKETFDTPVDHSAGGAAPETPVDALTPGGPVSGEFAGQGLSAIGGNAVAPDADFSGFRGGVDNALAGSVAELASNRVPRVQIGKSPPAAIIAFWLLLVPILLLLAFAYWLRRRRPVALQG